MEVLNNLMYGFSLALSWDNLMYCAIGCMIGTMIGMLPGMGPLSTISLLLPLTYAMPTSGALIMLAGIYYGAQYGDQVSAITMKMPHANTVVTCIDGYALTLKGKSGLALFTAGVSCFIGGTVAIVVLSTLAPTLAEVSFLFGPADYCALMLLGFVFVSHMSSSGSMLNGFAMALVGLLLGTVGIDVDSGFQRFTFGQHFLAEGIGLISVAMGCFGIAEIIKNLDKKTKFSPFTGKIELIPTRAEFMRIIPSALRGSVIGSILGLLPGGGPTLAQFGSYAVEKKFSKHRAEIGTGAIEGVAGPAAADEAAARTSFIPLMAIGIPENAVMALMMAAFIIKGIVPGPTMIGDHPDLFWGLVASMWIGNCFLLFLNVPMVKYWLSIFKIPYTALFPSILFFCCIGTFSIHNNLDDIYITALFGILGIVFLRLGLQAAPLMLGFILGPMLEENFRRAMVISRGSFTIFATRPISAVLMTLITVFLVWQAYSFVREIRQRRSAKLASASATATGTP
ncbi:MAG: tripartite tricarboxylate transporter permease [Pseudomonadota bacterium]